MATVASASSRQMTIERFFDTAGFAVDGAGFAWPAAPAAAGAGFAWPVTPAAGAFRFFIALLLLAPARCCGLIHFGDALV